MMSKMGVTFVLLLLFTLASSQQDGDAQARKTHLKSDFYRTLAMSTRACTGTCGQGVGCRGTCNCQGNAQCWCGTNGHFQTGCSCTCAG
uniref:Conotoxin n=1 Tax=Conus betulinus TaxID=89764 RepID=A0A142C1P6_CONBE|nr:conotoxin [Conus betulinus]